MIWLAIIPAVWALLCFLVIGSMAAATLRATPSTFCVPPSDEVRAMFMNTQPEGAHQ